MLKPTARQKLINAIVFFAERTQHCGKVKLFKLLYLLDFSHFRETGRSVTRLDYRAWRMGPVPLELMQEWDSLEPDLAEAIEIRPEPVYDHIRETVIPKVSFDPDLFTKRELRLMEELAARFRDELTKPMVEYTHAERGPWDRVWNGGEGKDAPIPYELAVPDDDPDRDTILEAAREHQGIVAANSCTR